MARYTITSTGKITISMVILFQLFSFLGLGFNPLNYSLDISYTEARANAVKKTKTQTGGSAPTLVGHWKMDEGSGNRLNDHSGLGNHAVFQDAKQVSWVTGVEGLAVNLPGTPGRFAVAPNSTSLNITDAITISAWIRAVDFTNRTILSKSGKDGYELGVLKDGRVEFRFNYDTNGNTYRLLSSTNYPANGTTWVHVAATFDGTTSRLYINGVLNSSATYPAPVAIKSNTTGLYIGSLLSDRRWKGALDDVRLYRGALSAAEVNILANGNPTPPAAPLLASPANGAVNVSLSPVLSWNAANGATKYRVQVSESELFTATVFDKADVTSTSVQAEGLATGKRYYWRVNASNDAGVSNWSQVWSFTTTLPPPPAAPVLASPANNSVDVAQNPVLSWNAASGALKYRAQVSENQNFTTSVFDRSDLTTTSVQVEGLAAGKTYYWRVHATNDSGTSDWSEVWRFTTVSPSNPAPLTLVHYWNFNAADLLAPTQTLAGGSITANLAEGATIEAGTLNNFAGINARNNDPAGNHLRLNIPIGSSLTFNVSTTGFKDVIFKYETRRSTQGAGKQLVSYSLNGTTFTQLQEVAVVDGIPELVTLDFKAIAGANNNANFKIRIQFEQGLGGIAGNNRFDNATLEGESTGAVNLPPVVSGSINLQQLIAGKPYSNIDLSTVFSDPEGAPLTYSTTNTNSAVASVTVVGKMLQINTLKAGDATIEVKASDGSLESAPTSFRVLVYPAAHTLSAVGFKFLSWDQNEPEGSFPENMVFLQSDIDDPVLDTELLYPYFIPASDYAAADAANIGFPYRNTSRTRINGLGNEGISFINTGRGRDLGAALVAIDTRNITDAKVSFNAATLVPNSRVYNLAVLYRVGTTGQWLPVYALNEQLLEYKSKEQAESTPETLTGYLPEAAIGKEYVQVLFKYYYTGEQRTTTSGARTQVRLDDIDLIKDVRSQVPLPGTVQLLTPEHNKQNVALKPDFSWQAAQNASTYQLQVSTNNQFNTVVAEKTVSGATTYKLENSLAVSTTYFWRVRAINSAGNGPWSGVFSFKTVATSITYKLAINEVMSSNSTTIADEDGSFEDWIELVNYGETAVNLQGFGLSDSYNNPFKWVFPSKVIAPGEFLLIWASNKNRTDPARPLHTSYAISADGEEVILTSPDGERVDEMPPVALPANISRGRKPDGTGAFIFFDQPTPGKSNQGGGFGDIIQRASFSMAPGVYPGNITVAITHPDPGVTLHYTLDGSEPTQQSPVYQTPLQIVDRSGEPNQHSMIPTNYIENSSRTWREPIGLVRKGTVVRVKAFKPNTIGSEIATGTFVVLPGRKYTMPLVSIVTAHDNLFGYEKGIYVPGATYVAGNEDTGNYNQLGDDWERPASFEFFAPEQSFQENIGIRINGDYTRRFPQKSLRLVARGQYGNSYMEHPVFQNYPYSSFKRLILRNAGNDWGNAMFRDAAAHILVKHIIPTQNYRPTVVYINGEYWGIHNLRERSDKHYIGRIFGVDPENIDLLTQRYTIQEGDDVHYKEMLNYIQTSDLSKDSNFEGVKARMDVDDFINYFSAEIYYGNDDWPQSNIDFWRARVPYNPNAPKGQDGRWRWILYDVDRAFGPNPDFNAVYWVTAPRNPDINQEWPNIIMRNLLKNEGFKQEFINRISDHLNTAFIPARVHHVIDSIKVILEPEMQEHINRWTRPSSLNSWSRSVQEMKTFASARPDYVRQHLKQEFSLGNQAAITLNVSNQAHGSIKINSLIINNKAVGVNASQPYPWQGIYFEGVPVTLKALASQGYKLDYWLVGTQIIRTDEIKVNPTNNLVITAYFIPSSGVVKPTLLSPANAATDVAINPTTLRWNALTGATSYRVQVSLSATFSTTVYNQANITATSAAVAGLANNTVYYWRVSATLSNGSSSDWSDIWNFRTVPTATPLPGAVTLNSPANGATGVDVNPILRWNASSNASNYTVQVSTASNFSSFVVNTDNVQNTSLQVTGLLNSRLYYWRVKANNQGGSSDWSAAWSFTTVQNTTGATLVGHWKMDEGSGSQFVDHSGLGNHATLQNSKDVAWTAGVQGLAANMPGTTDRYAVAPHHASLSITDALTIAAWIRPVDMSTRTVLSKTNPNGYELGINNDGRVEFRINYDSNGNAYRLVSNASYPTNGTTWMHVAATFDGTSTKIYINGALDASATYPAPIFIGANTSGLHIGALLTGRRWKGLLDDVRLYRGALSASQIMNIASLTASQTSATIMEEVQLKKAMLYPNPVDHTLNIKFYEKATGAVTISIVDVLGRKHTSSLHTLDGDHYTIDLAPLKLQSGLYFLIIDYPEHKDVFRFIKN